jgi:intracellular septation protein A
VNDPEQEPAADLREQTRQQLLDSLGGWSGTVVAAIPPVVFVIANALGGLRNAIIAAVAAGVLVAGYRLLRRQPVQQALMGLLSVAVAAAIAARTGQARGFFLLGIVGSIAYTAVFAVSMVVRRPLVGLIWEFLDPTPMPADERWHRVRPLMRAYLLATGAATAMFAARGAVQLSLFRDNKTGWLAVARLAMGYPLYIAVLGYAFWVIRRARTRLAGDRNAADQRAADTAGSSGADGLSDGGLSFGQGDEQ